MKLLHTRVFAYAILCLSAMAVSFFGVAFAAERSSAVRRVLGIAVQSGSLASASQTCVSQNDLGKDVYFVSCGGFF